MKKLLSVASSLALLMPSASAFSQEMMEQAETVSAVVSEVLSSRDEGSLTRAEFTSALVQALVPGTANLGCFDKLDANPVPPATFTLLFTDVTTNDPYAMELCAAFRAGYAKGYSDGSFHPHEVINTAEVAKMLTIAFALPAIVDEDAAWFAPYTEAVRAAGVTLKDPSSALTAEEAHQMIAHLKDLTGFAPAMQDDKIIEEIVEEEMDEEVTEEVIEDQAPETVEDGTPAEDTEETMEETSTGTGSVEIPGEEPVGTQS